VRWTLILGHQIFMLIKDTLQTAFHAISVNKTRSALTMLGIIIGVASVVLMVSMGNSFQNYILTQIEQVGAKTMAVMPKGLDKFGGNLDSMTFDDYEAIAKLPTVEGVAPVVIVPQTLKYGKEEQKPMILASYPDIFTNYSFKVQKGRPLEQSDDTGGNAVVVMAAKVAEDLFGNVDPIGKRVQIGVQTFTVIGTLEPAGSALMSQFDSLLLMPYSVGRALTGQKFLTYVTLRTKSDQSLTKQDITMLLRERHRINNPTNDEDKDDFQVQGTEQAQEIVGSVTMGLTIFLSLVAAISLLVGGIGIMNIMLVSVTERTREIGLRKAVGARRRDILFQFLIEAVSLTVSGGIIGIILGVYFGWILSLVAGKVLGEFHFILSVAAIVSAVVMAVGTGLIFGMYPAKKASELSPMEALRYE
jgi:putative ABC transport system permease protein